jgi:hypothetical protein
MRVVSIAYYVGCFLVRFWHAAAIRTGWYNPPMTLLEITYELQSPLRLDQLSRLGEFANTYGLRKFHVDEQRNHLTFEYDASRLRDTQIAHVLGQAGIAVLQRVQGNGSGDRLN